MKVVLQRVKSASVSVDGKLISSIGKGLLAFAAVSRDDTLKDVEKSAAKLLKMRLWDDGEGKSWKQSVLDIEGEVLCVSQFTLLASTKKGNKPDFHRSAPPDAARAIYSAFVEHLKSLYEPARIKDGIFQAYMDVSLVNDGPVGLSYTCIDDAVTLEINTDPPPLDVPSGMTGLSTATTVTGSYSMEDLVEGVQKLAKAGAFTMPPELLE
ncbi:hypothetical protein EJ06DRAFT_511782 [Trichodelitschia bisporula]|uniref:D-aminoacyl-tRNA deacylase n=1 Tax=Trichodelitschia bisporula TaxID=703511 RepID=A0A6G1HUL6_9PEZI|nr:hypothetical protein EJ06DRAFT_511782 [Trichodelitschia bisporula]